MTVYGNVLGTATALPATAGVGMYLLNIDQPWLITGFIGISFVSATLLAAYMFRYFANK